MTVGHVLVVGADPGMVRGIASGLAMIDPRTQIADGEADALARVAVYPFDVVIVDARLPDTDLVRLLSRIRGQLPRVESVVVEQEPSVESATIAVRARAADYLAGPSLSELDDTVRRLIANRRYEHQQYRDDRVAITNRMIAGLTHELRNPLNAAVLQLERCRRHMRGEHGALTEGLETVTHELRRIAHLLKDFETCVAPREPTWREVGAGELCRRIVDSAIRRAHRSNVEVVSEISDGLANLCLDVDAMRTAIDHIVQNGIEAMPDGGVLRIEAESSDDGVQIRIIDTGPGVTDEERIFDPFFTTKASGTGLGLAIAHRIITDHDGRIIVSSRPGYTCFVVELRGRGVN